MYQHHYLNCHRYRLPCFYGSSHTNSLTHTHQFNLHNPMRFSSLSNWCCFDTIWHENEAQVMSHVEVPTVLIAAWQLLLGSLNCFLMPSWDASSWNSWNSNSWEDRLSRLEDRVSSLEARWIRFAILSGIETLMLLEQESDFVVAVWVFVSFFIFHF